MPQFCARLRPGHHGGYDAEVSAAGRDGLHRLRHGAAQVGSLHFDHVRGHKALVVVPQCRGRRLSSPCPNAGAVVLRYVRRQDGLPVFRRHRMERIPNSLAVLVAPVVFDQAGRRQSVAVGGVNGHKRVRHALAPYPLRLLRVVLDQRRRHHALLRLGNLGVRRLRDFPPPLTAAGLPYGRQRRGDHHLMAARSAACDRVHRLRDPCPGRVLVVVHGQRRHDGGGDAIPVLCRHRLERRGGVLPPEVTRVVYHHQERLRVLYGELVHAPDHPPHGVGP